jgi:hypothetical protein
LEKFREMLLGYFIYPERGVAAVGAAHHLAALGR